MFADRIKETTATTGTGNVTLAGAVAGHGAFSSAFPLNTPIAYVIESGDDVEVGIGELTGSTTLVRTKITTTIKSGVYDNTAPTAITLAGTSTVYCSLQSNLILPGFSGIGDGSATEHIKSMHHGDTTPTTSAYLLLNRVYYTAFFNRSPGIAKELACAISTAVGTGSNKFRLGIYSRGITDGLPDTLLAETGDLDPSTTGYKSGSLGSSLYLPSGWYFIGILCDVTNYKIRAWNEGVLDSGLGISAGDASFRQLNDPQNTVSSGWTSMPATATATNGGSATLAANAYTIGMGS